MDGGYDVISFILRRPGVTNFADIMKIGLLKQLLKIKKSQKN